MIKKHKEEITRVADEAMANFIKELPNMIESKTSGAIASMFGFENKSWGCWTVDHCNGRMSEISGWISERAKKLFREECEKIITKKFVRDLIKETKGTMQKELKRKFIYEFKKKVIELAKKHAEEQSTIFMSGFKLALESDMEAIAQAAMEGKESKTQLAVMETEIEENA